MISFIRKGILIIMAWVGGIIGGCESKKVPLNKEQFTNLLIDLHKVDGTLSVYRGIGQGYNELKNYEYYNDVFRKYHIDKAEFDSCLYYYSAQTVLFSKMYDVVIDSIHRQLTAIEKVLNELKSKDSVNYFPLVDTLKLDSVFTITVDSIVPGLYKFGTTIHFDSLQNTQNRRIRSYFLSADGNDTLRVRDLVVDFDTLKRSYNWSQYADSVYNRLVITFLDTMPPAKYIKPVKGKKTPPAKKEKLVKLDEMGGEAWGTYLYRPYVSRETEKRLKQSLRRR